MQAQDKTTLLHTPTPRARPSAERRRQTPLGTDSIGPHQVNSYHGSGSPNLANPSQCVFGSLARNCPVAMAAQFIGLQMLVTLRGEQPVRIKGTVSDVEAGTGLTLSNGEFFFPFFFSLSVRRCSWRWPRGVLTCGLPPNSVGAEHQRVEAPDEDPLDGNRRSRRGPQHDCAESTRYRAAECPSRRPARCSAAAAAAAASARVHGPCRAGRG